MANGVPGIEMRLPLLFSEGVRKGRLDPQPVRRADRDQPRQLYGLYPRKGTIAVGADADIAIWDPESEMTHRPLDDARQRSATRPTRATSSRAGR